MPRQQHASALRVLVVTGSYPPEHTGSGLRISTTYRRLAARHPLVHRVVTLAPQGRPVPAGSPTAVRVAAGPAPLRALAVARRVRRLGRAADVGHLVGLTLETRVAAVVLRRLGVPYTVEPSVDPTPEPGWWQPSWVSRRLTDPLLLGNVSFVALTSRIAARHRPPGGDRSGLHLRPNPYHREDLATDAEAADAEAAAADDAAGAGVGDPTPAPAPAPAYRHLVLGRICPRKGHEQALRWLRELAPAHTLLVAGPLKEPADERYLAGLEAIVAADPALQGRVRFEPTFVTDTPGLLREVDAVWIPSTLEGMPNVAVEAACQGALVVMGEWLAAIEWFTALPGVGVAVGPDGADAALIAAACEQRPDRAAVAAAAREAFDLDRHVDELHDHLVGVAARGPGRRWSLGRSTARGRG